MLAGIVAFLEALPKLLELILRVNDFLKRQNINQWISDVEKTIDALEKAQTIQEKIDAARGLLDLVRQLK